MNNMDHIMESWRKYMTAVDTFEKQYSLRSGEYDTVYLIKENNQIESTNMSLLVEQYKEGSINENRLSDILIESIEYEYQQLLNEGVLDTLKKVAGKVGGVANKALAKAQFEARKVFFKVVYGTASKILRFVTALSQKAMKYLLAYVKQASQFKDKPPKPTVAQKLIARGVKVAKAVGALFKKVASFMIKVIQPIANFLGHPVVKNTLLVGCVVIVGVALAAPGAIAGTSMAFLVPFAGRKSGIEAIKALGGAGQYDLDKDKKYNFGKDKVNEENEIAFGVTKEVFAMLDDLSSEELGIAMNDIAEQIGSAKLDKAVDITTVQAVAVNPDGSEIVDFAEKAFVSYSDENLRSQFAALEMLKDAGRGGQSGLEVFESAKDLEIWEKKAAVIVKNSIAVAKDHCSSDPAACAGAEAFIDDIKIANTAVVNSEFVEVTEQSIKNAEFKLKELTADVTSSDQRFAVTRGGDAGEAAYYKSGEDLPAGYEEVPDREPEVRSKRRGIEN